jgi:hypothetical protein
MRTFWASGAGAILGLAGGLWGAGFGVVIGFLLDLVLADMRVQRSARQTLEGGEPPEWLPSQLPIAGALLSRVAPARATDTELISRLEHRLAAYRPDRFSVRLCERAIATGAALSTPEAELVRLLIGRLEPDERQVVVHALWETLREAPVPSGSFVELRRLALAAGIDRGFVERELVVRPRLDRMACEVLGVGAESTADQVRRAYRALAAQFHPDTTADLNETQRQESAEAFMRVREAYETLMRELDE